MAITLLVRQSCTTTLFSPILERGGRDEILNMLDVLGYLSCPWGSLANLFHLFHFH